MCDVVTCPVFSDLILFIHSQAAFLSSGALQQEPSTTINNHDNHEKVDTPTDSNNAGENMKMHWILKS